MDDNCQQKEATALDIKLKRRVANRNGIYETDQEADPWLCSVQKLPASKLQKGGDKDGDVMYGGFNF